MATKLTRADALSRGQLGSVPPDTLRDQAKNREFAVWYDQHKDTAFTNANGDRIFEDGRPYWSTTEKSTKMPVGPVYRAGWTAPWEPPQAYIVGSIGKIQKGHAFNGLMPKGVTTDRFRIDYTQMIADDKEAMRVYHGMVVRKASDLNLPIPRLGTRPDSRLIQIVGPPPRDHRIAQAALSGDKWLLGQLMPTFNAALGRMEVEVNEELARLLRYQSTDLLTAEEEEREQEMAERSVAAPPDAVQEIMAELREMKRKLAEMEGNAKPNKGGRPAGSKNKPKDTPTPAGV